jgi:carbon-monoxide dehydrogenase small subunit
MMHRIELKVNGKQVSADAESRMLLVHFLRETLNLTGTHIGCDTGHCGACTVILDGKAVKSCMILAPQASGSEVLTVEGLKNGDKLHPLQEAFHECHGLQCGYCTPGLLMAALYLLEKIPNPTEAEIRRGMYRICAHC